MRVRGQMFRKPSKTLDDRGDGQEKRSIWDLFKRWRGGRHFDEPVLMFAKVVKISTSIVRFERCRGGTVNGQRLIIEA